MKWAAQEGKADADAGPLLNTTLPSAERKRAPEA
jgi:hypothetical protein